MCFENALYFRTHRILNFQTREAQPVKSLQILLNPKMAEF